MACIALSLLQLGALAAAAAPAPSRPTVIEWVRQMPEAEIGPIGISESSCGDGSGLYLTDSVGEGALLLAVPMSAALSLEGAVGNPSIGAGLEACRCSDGDRAALAGLLAHERLLCEGGPGSWYHPYVTSLPERARGDAHVLYWSADEVALLAGTSAHDECLKLRSEVEGAIASLTAGALAGLVGIHGEAAVAGRVRDAYVSVFSRSFSMTAEANNIVRDGAWEDVLCLVPALDMLQHSDQPSVRYTYERTPSGAKRIEARAIRPLEAGTELSISYGAHPAMVFATHYGFIPADTASDGERSSRSTTLRLLSAEQTLLGVGTEAALAAQLAAESLDDDSTDAEWSEARLRADPDAALASLLASSGQCACYPLEFVVTVEALDRLRGTAPDQRVAGDSAVDAVDGADLEALRTCARLCSLEDDGSGASDGTQSRQAALEILLSGSVDPINDLHAAMLLGAVARSQLEEATEAAEALRLRSQPSSCDDSPPQAASPAVGADCLAMATALCRSEAEVLQRLCDSDDIGLLFGLSGWAVAAATQDEDD